MYSELRAQHELMVSYSGSLWLWKFWSFGFGLCHDEGHGGHCVGWSLVDVDREMMLEWHLGICAALVAVYCGPGARM